MSAVVAMPPVKREDNPAPSASPTAPAAVESVRLEPELQEALTQRAKRDRETTSSVIRRALRKYLEAH